MKIHSLVVISALVLALGTGPGAAQLSPYGRWLAEDINGGGVIDRLQTTLEITPEGRATGFGGCNAFTGSVTITGAAVAFGPLASTRKACPPAVMDQESKFHQVLAAAKGWRIDEQQRKLMLTDAAGKVVARLTQL